MEERVSGIFSARTTQTETVEFNFTPNVGCGNFRSLLAPGVGYIENDLVSIFGLRPDEARGAVAELERNGLVDVAASVDGAILSKLVLQRGVS
jgi:hypothetical protein